jgi:methyltransferase (TIGR00027 family)
MTCDDSVSITFVEARRMLPGQPSRTLLRSAVRRAAHQLLDQPLILDDPIVVDLVPEASDQAFLDSLDGSLAPDPKLSRILFAVRSRFAEDRLREAAARGVRQYVMAGAGLDTFPWRQPEFAKDMQLFAADHPASLAWTRERLRERGLPKPANLTFLPVDLEQERLGDRLTACGFQPAIATFCSALGLLQYLEQDAINALLRFTAALPTGSEFVCSFAPPDDELDRHDLDTATEGMARTAAIGEPWKSRLRARDLIERLARFGFSNIFHLTPELARQRYFSGHHDIQRPPRWEQIMAAIV